MLKDERTTPKVTVMVYGLSCEVVYWSAALSMLASRDMHFVHKQFCGGGLRGNNAGLPIDLILYIDVEIYLTTSNRKF